jgi:hypothetical protein
MEQVPLGLGIFFTANPAKVEDFGDKDLLQVWGWRESLSAE